MAAKRSTAEAGAPTGLPVAYATSPGRLAAPLFFKAPRIFSIASAICRTTSAAALAYHPHAIHRALLAMNNQNPRLRRPRDYATK